MRIYVASSWRNQYQPSVVEALVADGHDVYDFRNPPNRSGFAWGSIDADWQEWSVDEYIQHLTHPDAVAGFDEDMRALRAAAATVLVMPCGRSAHLELGWAVGAGQHTAVLLDHHSEPELMYKMVDLLTPSLDDITDWLAALTEGRS